MLAATARGEQTAGEAREILQRLYVREFWPLVEAGGRLANIPEIAGLLPPAARPALETIAEGYETLARLHVGLRRDWSPCEKFEVPADRSGLWETLEQIGDEPVQGNRHERHEGGHEETPQAAEAVPLWVARPPSGAVMPDLPSSRPCSLIHT